MKNKTFSDHRFFWFFHLYLKIKINQKDIVTSPSKKKDVIIRSNNKTKNNRKSLAGRNNCLLSPGAWFWGKKTSFGSILYKNDVYYLMEDFKKDFHVEVLSPK